MKVEMRSLPITLPSLNVASIFVPVPMTDEDFEFIEETLRAIRPSLTKPLLPPTPTPQGETKEQQP